MPTKITIQNESRLPMVYLMRRLALDMRHPESLEIAVNKFALEESTIDRSLSIGVCRSENNVAFVVKGLGAPDPSRPIKVEVRNGTMCPDYIILEDAAELYGKHQENFLLGCDATDYIKDESTETLSRTIYLDTTMRNGVVTISFWDKLESSLSLALDALKKQVTNWKEVPQAIEAIEAIYKKAKASCPTGLEQPPTQESATRRESLAKEGDIVVFDDPDIHLTSLFKVEKVSFDESTDRFRYHGCWYYPWANRHDPYDGFFYEDALHYICDESQLKACRMLFSRLQNVFDDMKVPGATIADECMPSCSEENWPPVGDFNVQVPYAYRDVKQDSQPTQLEEPPASEDIETPAKVDDIVVFSDHDCIGSISPFMRIRSITCDDQTQEVLYHCSQYDPGSGVTEQEQELRKAIDLFAVFDRRYINDCRELLVGIQKLVYASPLGGHCKYRFSMSRNCLPAGSKGEDGYNAGMDISISAQYPFTRP